MGQQDSKYDLTDENFEMSARKVLEYSGIPNEKIKYYNV